MSRKRLFALVALAALGLLLIAAFWLSRPTQLSGILLGRAGAALGLEITASGEASYRLRGTPMLEVRGLVAREPGADTPLLTAERALLALPWSTLRDPDAGLVVQRVELDAPRLDLAALRHWLATRPPSEAPRLPVLADGLRIERGQLQAGGWQLAELDIETDRFHPEQPLAGTTRGRYLDAPVELGFDLRIGLGQAQALLKRRATPISAHGDIDIRNGGITIPATLNLSGPLRWDGVLSIEPLRLGASARYRSGDTDLPFILGAHGPLRLDAARLSLAPDALILRGKGADSAIPTLQSQGLLALDTGADATLRIALDGALATWPEAWPALPPPIGQSASPLPFALRYAGALDASDTARLQLTRDATRFDARFRLPQVLDWLSNFDNGTPLPPLRGRLETPRVEVAGAVLEGVTVEFEDEAE